MLCVNMSIHVYVSQTAGIQPLLAALPVKLSRSRVDRERQRVQHATFTHYKHTQSHPCVASLPGIQRGWQARKTQRTLCSQTYMYIHVFKHLWLAKRMNFGNACHHHSDIDECSEGTSGCEQVCINNDGSYSCSCYAEYALAPNLHICLGMLMMLPSAPFASIQWCSSLKSSKLIPPQGWLLAMRVTNWEQ